MTDIKWKAWVDTEPMLLSELNAEDRHVLRFIWREYPMMKFSYLNMTAIAAFMADRHIFPLEQYWVARKRTQRARKRQKRALGRGRW